ncbi:MAG: DUF6923 family protein, partial [Planctomycetota bacterium]
MDRAEVRQIELNNLGFRTTDGMLYAMALKVFVEGASAQNGNYGIVKIDSTGNIFPVSVPAPAPIPGIGNNAYRFPAGEITPDGSTMYINAQVTSNATTANETLYKVDLDTLVVSTVTKNINAGAISTVNVADWAVNPLDGMLYGGAPQVSPARIWKLNPDTGEMTIVPGSGAIGLPNGTDTLDAFGGAWFNAAGHLFLYRNVGEIYEIDLDSSTTVGGCTGGPCPELLSVQFGGPTSTFNDATACVAEQPSIFDCTGEAFIVHDPDGGTAPFDSQLFQVDQSVDPVTFTAIHPTKNTFEINNIGFDSTRGILWGWKRISPANADRSQQEVVTIDATGTVFFMGVPAGLPTPLQRFMAGDVAPDGSVFYLNENGGGNVYTLSLPGLAVLSSALIDEVGTAAACTSAPDNPCGRVSDWAAWTDGLLYGGDDTNGELAVLDPVTGIRSDVLIAGLPTGIGFGAVWFSPSGNLFLFRNVSTSDPTKGAIYEIGDISGTPTIVNVQLVDRTSQQNDGAACLTPAPKILLTKTVEPNLVPADTGGEVAYTYTITNLSNESITLTSLIDSELGDVNELGDCSLAGVILEPAGQAGDTYSCTVPEILITAPTINVATACGKDAANIEICDDDSAQVDVYGIDILKKPDLQVVAFGGDVTFTIIVTNTGSVDLTDVTVTDPLAPDCNNLIGDLAAGESFVYDCTVTNVTEDFTNTACVEGTTPDQTTVTDCNDGDVVVVVVECPAVPA